MSVYKYLKKCIKHQRDMDEFTKVPRAIEKSLAPMINLANQANKMRLTLDDSFIADTLAIQIRLENLQKRLSSKPPRHKSRNKGEWLGKMLALESERNEILKGSPPESVGKFIKLAPCSATRLGVTALAVIFFPTNRFLKRSMVYEHETRKFIASSHQAVTRRRIDSQRV